ncbi:unnamed protein product, partial [Allacma fusca]
KIRYF